jgi:Lrp/AsnC family transcriptional regulator for asnA, asnC and gidA
VEKLDLKDRKILYHLRNDSRQSFSQIGKKIGLHKDVVAYRVNKMIDNGIIHYFFTCVNEHKLGYSMLRFYLTFQYVSPNLKKEIIEYFLKNIPSIAVHTSEGKYDLILVINVKNIVNFSYKWDKIFSKYRDNFSNQVFSILCEVSMYKYSFLTNGTEKTQSNRLIAVDHDDGKVVEIDELDEKILKLLAANARMPTIEIAEKLNTTAITINNRIKNLINTGIILNFQVNIDYTKIGYKWIKADIVLKDPSKAQKIITYIEKNPNLVTKIKSIGYVDLELVFWFKTINELHQLIEEVSEKFPDAIKNYTFITLSQTYRHQSIPDE